ncbi:unnamed protein product [Clonostachys rosea]|uniref:Uncharacterized protein n=1 Tax=Bionectria ochroleuca TaxID=29856 RepID=A0ABY6U547_BIOOC|nr:unnamed protein product [Clonostachys rosea]
MTHPQNFQTFVAQMRAMLDQQSATLATLCQGIRQLETKVDGLSKEAIQLDTRVEGLESRVTHIDVDASKLAPGIKQPNGKFDDANQGLTYNDLRWAVNRSSIALNPMRVFSPFHHVRTAQPIPSFTHNDRCLLDLNKSELVRTLNALGADTSGLDIDTLRVAILRLIYFLGWKQG